MNHLASVGLEEARKVSPTVMSIGGRLIGASAHVSPRLRGVKALAGIQASAVLSVVRAGHLCRHRSWGHGCPAKGDEHCLFSWCPFWATRWFVLYMFGH